MGSIGRMVVEELNGWFQDVVHVLLDSFCIGCGCSAERPANFGLADRPITADTFENSHRVVLVCDQITG